MSALVKLSSALPGHEDTNGVDSIVGELIEEPAAIRVAVVHFDVVKKIDNTDTGETVPVLRVRRFEPLGMVGDVAPEIRAAVATAHELRTGRAALPFEAVEGAEHEIED